MKNDLFLRVSMWTGAILRNPMSALVATVYGFGLLLIVHRLIWLIGEGGGNYQSADWLINFSSGIVRRGASGESILFLSDTLQVSPLYFLGFMQGIITATIVVALFLKGVSLKMPERVALLLLSPALVLFWVNDFDGALRKEILAYLAFIPLLIPAVNEIWRRVLPATTVVIFAVAVAFHEANAFMAPLLAVAMIARYKRLPDPRGVVAPVACIFAIAVLGVAFAATFASVPSSEAMCIRVTSAGLDQNVCSGIFSWLEDRFSKNTQSTLELFRNSSVITALLLYTACFFPLLAAAQSITASGVERAVVILAAMALLPLFFVGMDWGRWTSMQVFGLAFVLLISAESETTARLERQMPRLMLAAGLALSLGVGISHVDLSARGGFITNLADSLGSVLP